MWGGGEELAVNLYFLLSFQCRWWCETFNFFLRTHKFSLTGSCGQARMYPWEGLGRSCGFQIYCCPPCFLLSQLMWALAQYNFRPVPRSLMLGQILTQNWKALLWKAHVENLDGVKPKSAMKVKAVCLSLLSFVHIGFFLSKEIKNQKGATPILEPCFSWANSNSKLRSGSLLPTHPFAYSAIKINCYCVSRRCFLICSNQWSSNNL